MPEQNTKISVASEKPQRAGIQLVKKLPGVQNCAAYSAHARAMQPADVAAIREVMLRFRRKKTRNMYNPILLRRGNTSPFLHNETCDNS